MKKIVLSIAMVFIAATALISCREEAETTTVIKEVEVTKPAETKESEGILERTAKKVDQEVNKEINEEIEKIGDDN